MDVKSEKSEEEILSSNWIEKMQIFQTGMDHEQSIRTNYQSILITFELAIFGLLFTLNQLETNKPIQHLWVLPTMGIFLCVVYGIPCEFRARNADYWRNEIVKLVRGTDLEEKFLHAKYRWIPLGKIGVMGENLFGHWFERILIFLILLYWNFQLWFLLKSFTIYSVNVNAFIIFLASLIASCLWFIYVFKGINVTGEIIIDDSLENS